MLSFDDYISLLHKLGFIKFDLKKQKDLTHKKIQQEEEKKIQENKDNVLVSSPNDNSNIQQTVIKNEKNIKRGKSEKPEDRVFKKVDKEIKVITESWKYLAKKDQEKVNTNQILVFLAGILGLYKGETPEVESSGNNNIKVEIKENDVGSNINPVEEIKTNINENKEDLNNKGSIKAIENNLSDEKKDNVNLNVIKQMKINKSNENLGVLKKNKKSKHFINSLPFNCGTNHAGLKKTQKETKSEEKKLKKIEILLKKVVPELDLSLYAFSSKLMNHLKFYFRYFYDNRMNFLLKEKRKLYNNKTISQSELIFKPKLNAKTIKSAEEYRKKCKEVSIPNII